MRPDAAPGLPHHWIAWLSWRASAERPRPSLLARLLRHKPKPPPCSGLMLCAGGGVTLPKTTSKRRRS